VFRCVLCCAYPVCRKCFRAHLVCAQCLKRVDSVAFQAVSLLGNTGGWQDWPGKWNSKPKAKAASTEEEVLNDEKGSKKKVAAVGSKAEVVAPKDEIKDDSAPKVQRSKRRKTQS
jgi:hypothetical protein